MSTIIKIDMSKYKPKLENITKLQTMREARGYSRVKLCSLSGIPRSTLSKYEQRALDISKAKEDRIEVLCKILKCNREDII